MKGKRLVLAATLAAAGIAAFLAVRQHARGPEASAPAEAGATTTTGSPEAVLSPEPSPVAGALPEAPPEAVPAAEELIDAASRGDRPGPPSADPAMQELRRLQAVQDEAYRRAPRYAQAREQAARDAEALLSSRGIAIMDTEEVLALVQEELDAFYDAGGLDSAEAYRYGYTARALCEKALAADGENFVLLTALRESISTTALFYWCDYMPNEDSDGDLRQVLEKQKAMVLSGKVPLSPDAMLVMYDWQHMVGREGYTDPAYLETWQWIVDNAVACGWGAAKPLLDRGLADAKRKRGFATDIIAYAYSSREEHLKQMVLTRGLPSQHAGRDMREVELKIWKDYDKMYYAPGK